MATHVYAWTHIMIFEMKKGASVPTVIGAEKSGYFVFPAFCFLCHHYFIHGFRTSTCVIWANSIDVFIVISTRVCVNAIVPAAARAKGLDIHILLICVYKWIIIFHIHLHWHFIHFFHYGFNFFVHHLANSTVLFRKRQFSTHIYFMYFSSLIRTKILLPWEVPVEWYLICIIRFMLFICVLKYDLWAPSYLMLYTAWMLFKWKTTFSVCKHILILMNLFNNSLSGIICMCVGDIYMCACVRIRVCVTHIRVHTHTRTLHVSMSHAFTCWCSLCVCVCASIWDGMCAIL